MAKIIFNTRAVKKLTMKKYLIYLCKNIINNKIYIGRTKDLEKRIFFHIRDAKYGKKNKTLFHKSINKYGIDNFSFTILEERLSEEESKKKEIYYIDKYNAKVPNGMNLTTGGDGVSNPSDDVRKRISEGNKGRECFWKGKKLSEEHKRKISEAKTGIVMSKETKKKISEGNKGKIRSEEMKCRYSESHKGITSWAKGKKFSIEHRKKMSISRGHLPTRLGMEATPETLHKRSLAMIGKNSKEVVCLETQRIYSSLTKAAKELNIHIGSISKCIKKQRKTAGGYTWEYVK